MTFDCAKKVLIVEDDFDIREAMRDQLMDEGYAVEIAENGAVALTYLRSVTDLPCVIFLDISMPVLDGYGFRREQILDTRLSAIPTVMISADGHIMAKAQSVGVAEYIRKPIDLTQLFQLTAKFCQTS